MSLFFLYKRFCFLFFSLPAEMGSRLGRAGLDLPGDGPDKAGEFAGDGGHGHLRLLPAHTGQMRVAVMQPALGFPGNVGDGFWQTFLPLFQVGTQAGGGAILPRGFDQGAAGWGVTHFGDAALLAVVAGGVFAGNQSEITH